MKSKDLMKNKKKQCSRCKKYKDIRPHDKTGICWECCEELENIHLKKRDKSFIKHIQGHLKKGEKVICKICGKTVDEIIKENGK